jgi:hypothetical protein
MYCCSQTGSYRPNLLTGHYSPANPEINGEARPIALHPPGLSVQDRLAPPATVRAANSGGTPVRHLHLHETAHLPRRASAGGCSAGRRQGTLVDAEVRQKEENG